MPAEFLTTGLKRSALVSAEILSTDPLDAQLFTNKLSLAASVAQNQNAFIYLIPQRQYIQHGKRSLGESLNFTSLFVYLNNSQEQFEIIDAPIDDVYTPSTHSLAVFLLQDEAKNARAIFGTFFPINRPLDTSTKDLLLLIKDDLNQLLSLQEQVLELKELQSRYVQISELNQDYICVKDNRHKIVYANHAMLETFPANLKQTVIGNIDLLFYEPETSATIVDSDLHALEHGFYSGNQLITLANGQDKILETTKKTFVGSDKNTYIMSVSRDVTEKEILINDLKRSNDDLDNFAYVASHDLKSPLNVIKRLVSWVLEDCQEMLPQDSKENLALVLNRATRMEKLLVDLLSYSRLGKDYQANGEVNLKSLVIELLSLIDLPMGFVVNCDDLYISVPAVPFNVVMLNLINNAIKHHDSGNAKIEIKAKRGAKGATITVQDNGPGIASHNRERIFKLFETLKPRDEVEGSGMGLSVVKKIVEHYGGCITVETNQPRGTKFIVTWPTTNIAQSVLSNLND